MLYSRCTQCNIDKKHTKSERCYSCARKKQHSDGVYISNKINFISGFKHCNHCNDNHEIIENESNEFWLMRQSNNYTRYDCRVHRRYLYDKARKDPKKRLRKSVSNLIRDCVSKQGAFKSGSFPKYVDFTVEELKTHLEAQFTEGMSWDNYGRGGWHIDHIRPDSWFDYSSMEDEGFKESWSLNNLQPMWEKDNCSKGNRFSG